LVTVNLKKINRPSNMIATVSTAATNVFKRTELPRARSKQIWEGIAIGTLILGNLIWLNKSVAEGQSL
jgi:hypothetical protein